MSIRKKSIISLLAIISLLLLGLSYAARHIFLDRFQDLEDQALAINMQRVQNAVDGKLRAILALTTDWAVWNDSYDFVQTRDPGYRDANFHRETLRAQNLNLIVVLDRHGLPIQSAYYDEQSGGFSFQAPETDAILEHTDLLRARANDSEHSGLLNINGQALLIASRAILRTDKSGSFAGTMIMARWLSPALQEEVAEETRLALEFKPLGATPSAIVPITHDARVVTGSLVLADMYGHPLRLVRVQMNRDISSAGRTALGTHINALLAFGAAFTLLVVFVLDRIILSRLSTLTQEVRAARTSTNQTVTVDGQDELTALQTNINTLLHDIRTSESSYESFFRNNGTANAVIDQDGLIHLVNAEFEHLAGMNRSMLERQAHISTFLPGADQNQLACIPLRHGPFCAMSQELLFCGQDHQRTVLAAISPLPSQNRQILALQDISDLKASQQELLELSRELERRVESRTRDLAAANAALEEEIRQRAVTSLILETANAVSLALSTADTVTTAFDLLLEQVCRLTPIDCGTAYVHDHEPSRYELVAHHGLPAEMHEGLRVVPTGSVLGRLLEEGKPIYAGYDFFAEVSQHTYSQAGLLVVGVIPILFQSRVVATLNVGSRTAPDIPPAIRSILDTIATQTGGAIVRIASQEKSTRTAKEMEAIFENSAVGIMHLSPDRTILKVNQRLAGMFGYERQELIGQHVRILHVSATTCDEFRNLYYHRLYSEHQVLNVEQRMKTSDGSIRWFTFHGRMIDPDDARSGFVWIIEDIHDVKTADEERSRYMEELQIARDLEEENAAKLVQIVEELETAKHMAESASRMKSQFLANVSHEIRTPMNAIMGMTDVVLGTSVTPEQRRALTIVKNSSEALLDVINGVLDLSKIEAGQFELETRSFDLRPVIEKTVSTLGLTATEKGLDLICHLPPDLPQQVEGDPIRLRQVLINLLGNAVKFTPSGHVFCSCHIEHEEEDAWMLHFLVEDTGIGIHADKQGSIFEDFSQVDSSSTRVYGGTGLGLSISRRLVQMMHGELWVQSTPGQGSTFQFTARVGKVLPPDMTHAHVFEDAATVLAVIGNRRNREQVGALLAFWGLNCAFRSCLDCQADPLPAFDLVILDTDFGDHECLQLLGPDGPFQAVPTIVLTHLGDQSLSVRGAIKAVLTKPLLQDELLRALAGVFGLRLHLPENLATVQTVRSARPLDILLVEDVATNRELAELVLRKMGHTVHDARDGLDALTLLGRHSYDLIFMDLQMPVMDGFTATQIIRACEQGQPASSDMDDSFLVRELRDKIAGTHTPIVAMTAHAMLQDRQRCLEIGMDAYLTKPLRLEEVHAVLASIGSDRTPPDNPASVIQVDQGQVEEIDSAPPDDLLTHIHQELRHRYGLEEDQVQPLIDSLLQSLEEHLLALPAAISSLDRPELTHHAHSLKGLFLNMGLTIQARTAQDLEESARNDGPDQDLLQRGQSLRDAAEAVRIGIRNFFTPDHEEKP